MSWVADVKELLENKLDGGRTERDWDKTVASMVKAIDDMCSDYLGDKGAIKVEFEVAPDKVNYMPEVLHDADLRVKFDIRQISPTLYEARYNEIEF